MAFGGKTVAALVESLGNASLDVLDISNNSSFKMKPKENMQALSDLLKTHKGVKRFICVDCDINDPTCEVLAGILAENHTIEELNLEKNKISSDGAKMLAEGLAKNHGLRTLNLLQQHVKAFGDDCLTSFADMYNNNITLTKITWRLDSRKSFMLAKLQTRNIEIAKRQTAGKEFEDLLPDHMRGAKSTDSSLTGDEKAACAPLVKRTSIADLEPHLESLNTAMADVTITDDAALPAEEPAAAGYNATEAPAAQEEPAAAAEAMADVTITDDAALPAEEPAAAGYNATEAPAAPEEPAAAAEAEEPDAEAAAAA